VQKTIDDYFDFLQNKTIKTVGNDEIDGNYSLEFVLSDGSILHIFSFSSLYMAIEPHIIN
jgi:hypothetical protein